MPIKVLGLDHLPGGVALGTGQTGYGMLYSEHTLGQKKNAAGNHNNVYCRPENGKLYFFKDNVAGQLASGFTQIPYATLLPGQQDVDKIIIGYRLERLYKLYANTPTWSLSQYADPKGAETDYGTILAAGWIYTTDDPGVNYHEIMLDFSTMKYETMKDGVLQTSGALGAQVTKANFRSKHWLIGRMGTSILNLTTAQSELGLWNISDVYIRTEIIGVDEPIAYLGPIKAKRVPVLSSDAVGWTPSAGAIKDVLNTNKASGVIDTPFVTSAADLTPAKLNLDTSVLSNKKIAAITVLATGYRDGGQAGALDGKLVYAGNPSSPVVIPSTQLTARQPAAIVNLIELPGGVDLTKANLTNAQVVLTPS